MTYETHQVDNLLQAIDSYADTKGKIRSASDEETGALISMAVSQWRLLMDIRRSMNRSERWQP